MKFIFLQLIFCGYAMFGYRDDFFNNQVRLQLQPRINFFFKIFEKRGPYRSFADFAAGFNQQAPLEDYSVKKWLPWLSVINKNFLFAEISAILFYTFEALFRQPTYSAKLGGSEAAYSASQIDSKNLCKSPTSRPWSDKNTSSLKVSIFVTNFFPTRHRITRSMARTVRNFLNSRIVRALNFINSPGLKLTHLDYCQKQGKN